MGKRLRGTGFVDDANCWLLDKRVRFWALREKAVVGGRGVLWVLEGWGGRPRLVAPQLWGNSFFDKGRPALEVHPNYQHDQDQRGHEYKHNVKLRVDI